MSDITLSLLGIYNQAPEILDADTLLLPAGIDREVLVPRLLAETAELEILYPEPTTLQTVIRAWSAARRPSWERIYAALTAEYNPLHNYDRTETESGTDTGTVHTDDDSTDTGTVRNVEEISDTGSGTNSATTQGDVTGYNRTPLPATTNRPPPATTPPARPATATIPKLATCPADGTSWRRATWPTPAASAPMAISE